MNEIISNKQLFEFYLAHVIREASASSDRLICSYLLGKRFLKNYLTNQILFITQTESLNVESEIDEWLEIYKWISQKKDELLVRYSVDKVKMIILYPRFINYEEYKELKEDELKNIEKKLIIWYK